MPRRLVLDLDAEEAGRAPREHDRTVRRQQVGGAHRSGRSSAGRPSGGERTTAPCPASWSGRRRRPARRPCRRGSGRRHWVRRGHPTVASAPGSRSPSTATVWPNTTAVRSRRWVGGVPDRPGEPPVFESKVGLDERHGDGRVGADRPQRAEPDGEVADPRRVALEDVEGAPGPGATEVAVDRRRQQRPAGDADLVDPARGREDPEVDLGGAVRGARRAADDGHLVDDHVAAAQDGPEAVGAGGEDHDQDRHREPRPLAPVESLEDEVVDRADQQDVGAEQDEQPTDRAGAPGTAAVRRPARAGCRRRTRGRRGARRQQAPPQALRHVGLRDPVGRGVEADQRRPSPSRRRDRPATTRSPTVARARPAISSPDQAGRVGGRRRQLAEHARRGWPPGRRSWRPGGTAAGRRGRRTAAFGPGRATGDDQATAAGDPAAERIALGSVRRSESTSCQTIRSIAPHASTRSGRSSGASAQHERRDLVPVRQQVEAPDHAARGAPRRRPRSAASRRGSGTSPWPRRSSGRRRRGRPAARSRRLGGWAYRT